MKTFQSLLVSLTVVGGLILAASGCATTGRVKSDIVTTSFTPPVSAFNEGEPIYTAEMAADLAELALAQIGIDCRGYLSKLSFMEGSYYIAFRTPEGTPQPAILVVQLDATTSKIVNVTKTTTRLAS